MEMDVLPSTSEIVEPTEGLDFDLKIDEKAGKCYIPKLGRRYSIEDEINSLFEAIDIRTSGMGVGLPHESSKASLWKKAMKRPIRVGSSQLSGIGISEPVSLKQALRGLRISQASEMAAMKRLSRPAVTSGASEAGTIKRLDSTVIVEANGSGHPLSECNLVEKSLVPERITSDFSKKTCESSQKEKAELSHQKTYSSPYRVVPLHTGCSSEVAKNEVERFKSTDFSSTSHATKKLAEVDEKTAASIQVLGKAPVSEGKKTNFHTSSLSPNCRFGSTANNPAPTPPQLMKLIFRKNIFVKRKLKPDLYPVSGISSHCGGRDNNDHDPSTSNSDICEYTPQIRREEGLKASPASSAMNCSTECNSGIEDSRSSNQGSNHSGYRTKSILTKVDERSRSRSREEGELSQSSKSSIGDYSSSTSGSDDSKYKWV